MEIELMFSGIGGQGVQLVARILVSAAVAEGRYVMLTTDISGEMRGGLSNCTAVIADHPVKALPNTDEAASALIFHYKFSGKVVKCLRPGAVVMVNSTVCEDKPQGENLQIWNIPATSIAENMGLPMTAGMVMLGAYNQVAGLVKHDALITAIHHEVPPYRKQHIEGNIKALQTGADYVRGTDNGGASVWDSASPLLRAIA